MWVSSLEVALEQMRHLLCGGKKGARRELSREGINYYFK